MKGFPLGLSLRERRKATRKWAIAVAKNASPEINLYYLTFCLLLSPSPEIVYLGSDWPISQCVPQLCLVCFIIIEYCPVLSQ